MLRPALPLLLLALLGGAPATAETVPLPVVDALHGRAVGWARSGPDWVVVSLARQGSGWCGLTGASWHLSLVETASLPARVVDDVALGGAMCGNELAWVRSGRFSDGRHREVAFQLWTTPAIGAWTYVFRLDGERLRRLGAIPGDRVVLGRGSATASWENRGRSPHGELTDRYRFRSGSYRLVARGS